MALLLVLLTVAMSVSPFAFEHPDILGMALTSLAVF